MTCKKKKSEFLAHVGLRDRFREFTMLAMVKKLRPNLDLWPSPSLPIVGPGICLAWAHGPLLCLRLRLYHKAGVPQTLRCSCGLQYLFFHFRYQPLRESSRWWSYVSNWESNRLSIPLTKNLSGTPGRWLDPQLEPAQPGSFMKQERFKNPLCRKWNF